MIKFSRKWAMPNCETFSIQCIAEFIGKYLEKSQCSVDPFARNSKLAMTTNDLNPETTAKYHYEANEFLNGMASIRHVFDLVLFDPPYSVRQIQECYNGIGKVVTQKDTQCPYTEWKRNISRVCADDAVVLSFGWDSNGMGQKHGFEIIEIMLVAHGGAHHDTICVAEKKIKGLGF